MRFASPIVGFLTLALLVASPVGGTPALNLGSKATYNLKSAVSFSPIVCQGQSTSMIQTSLIMCPLIATLPSSINVTGALGWNITSLTGTTAVLNVTRDVTISHDNLMIPSFRETGSFNESISLATRIIHLMPFIETGIDAALQPAQNAVAASLPSGIDSSLSASAIDPTSLERPPIYTMWWVNETLQRGQIVPVLGFNTTVTGSTVVNIAGLQPRDAWTLVYNQTLIVPEPTSTSSPSWINHNTETVFTFNYDKKSGLLLSASADIHRGFEFVEPQCITSSTATTATCNPATASIVQMGECGFDVEASLILASTSLNLDNAMPATSPSGGENPSSGPSPGPASGSSGNPGTNPNDYGGGNQASNPASGSNSNGGTSSGSGSTSGSQSSSQPAPTSSSPGSLLYLILGLVAVAIVIASLLFVRRQSRKDQSSS